MAWSRMSARGPGAELVGVAYGPDVGDLVTGDLEGEHRDGDAIVLGDQAWLAVDRAFEDGHSWCAGGEVSQVAGDLLATVNRVQRGAGQAAVGDHRRSGVEQADEGFDVPGFPGFL
jgi:hypothetical protein